MAESVHDRIARLRTATSRDPNQTDTFRRYARGDQFCTLTTEQRRIIYPIIPERFADNICDKIVSTVASRAELTGFAVDDPDVQTFLDEDLWIKNRMDRKQYDIHYAAPRDGNVATILGWKVTEHDSAGEPSAGRVTAHLEPWWDGVTGSWVCYTDEDEEPEFGVKEWEIRDPNVGARSKRTLRLRNIYFHDRIERYVLRGPVWEPYDGSAEGIDKLPVEPWLKRNGSPLGVPMIHFSNQKASGARSYGMSDLDGGIIGIQDQINDIHWDIISAARTTGFQVYFVTGYQPEIDANGDEETLYIGPGYIITSANSDARVGALNAGDMSKLIDVLIAKKQAAASSTRTPEFVITGGDWPSGLALMRAEQPLVDKTIQLTKTTGPSWATLAHRSTEIQNAFGIDTLDENKMIKPLFAAPERLDPTAQAESDKAKVGALVQLQQLDDAVLLKKSGLLNDKEIATMMLERKKRAQEMTALMVGSGPDRPETGASGDAI